MSRQKSDLKVAVVTPYGAEARYDNYAEFILAKMLVDRGVPARMYTYAIRSNPVYARDAVYMDVPVMRCRHRLAFSPRLFFSILFYRPSVVICFHPKNLLNLTAYIASRLVGAKFIVEIVGILHDPYIVTDTDEPETNLRNPVRLVTDLRGLVREIMAGRIRGLWKNYACHMPTAHADEVIAINDDEKRWISRFYGRDSRRIYWCTPKFVASGAVAPVREIPEKYLFFIGQIKRRKGWDTAIDALASLKNVGNIAHLVFVTPQKSFEEPIAYAEKMGVREQITFLSAVTNKEKNWLYEHASCVLIPSRYEGFGLPVFEAFLAKKPICATSITVFEEFLHDRENALLFPIGDGVALAASIELLQSDPILRERLVKGGERTAEVFSAERMVEKYLEILE